MWYLDGAPLAEAGRTNTRVRHVAPPTGKFGVNLVAGGPTLRNITHHTKMMNKNHEQLMN